MIDKEGLPDAFDPEHPIDPAIRKEIGATLLRVE